MASSRQSARSEKRRKLDQSEEKAFFPHFSSPHSLEAALSQYDNISETEREFWRCFFGFKPEEVSLDCEVCGKTCSRQDLLEKHKSRHIFPFNLADAHRMSMAEGKFFLSISDVKRQLGFPCYRRSRSSSRSSSSSSVLSSRSSSSSSASSFSSDSSPYPSSTSFSPSPASGLAPALTSEVPTLRRTNGQLYDLESNKKILCDCISGVDYTIMGDEPCLSLSGLRKIVRSLEKPSQRERARELSKIVDPHYSVQRHRRRYRRKKRRHLYE